MAGLQAGMDKGSNTRSGLLWEVERLLYEARDKNVLPDVLLMENVTAIHNKKNLPNFELWLDSLKELGYSTFYSDLNAKHYGVAQNRPRTFAVSILGEAYYEFPQPIPLTKTIKDYLEDSVEERFYIKTENARKLIGDLIDRGDLPREGGKEGVDLSTNQPEIRTVSNALKAGCRGITNFRQDEIGVVEAK